MNFLKQMYVHQPIISLLTSQTKLKILKITSFLLFIDSNWAQRVPLTLRKCVMYIPTRQCPEI